jgi:hypothetical protein
MEMRWANGRNGVEMAKPVFRIGVPVDKEAWEILLQAERFEGIEALDFIVDTSQSSIWLCFVAEDHKTVHRLQDITTKAGGLPIKWAGERRESAELFNSYFRAAVAVAKAEQRIQGTGPDESPTLSIGLETAKKELEDARARFESALKSDARGEAEDYEVQQVSDESGGDESPT